MFKLIIRTSVLLSVFAANTSYAQPEMDALGRDITSGPLPAITVSQASATADAENTGSINEAIKCSRQNPKACPPKAQH